MVGHEAGAGPGASAETGSDVVRVVGVVGTGGTARDHLAAWSAAGYSVVVLSRSAERACAFAAKQRGDVRAAANWDELVAAADLVDLCTPTDTHAASILAAAEAGRHIVCEKPIARDLTSARAARAACQLADVRLLVGHRLRYVPAYAAVQHVASSGALGGLTELRFTRYGERPPTGWFTDPGRSGGVLLDLAIHDYDYARWLAGEVVTVDASAEQDVGGLPVRCRVELTHAWGARTVVEAGWTAPGTAFRSTVDLCGGAGEVSCDSAKERPVWSSGEPVEVEAVDPFYAQFADFVAAVERRTLPRVTLDDAVAALAIALAAERSANLGRPVPLAEIEA